jgi:hypothetical protein
MSLSGAVVRGPFLNEVDMNSVWPTAEVQLPAQRVAPSGAAEGCGLPSRHPHSTLFATHWLVLLPASYYHSAAPRRMQRSTWCSSSVMVLSLGQIGGMLHGRNEGSMWVHVLIARLQSVQR